MILWDPPLQSRGLCRVLVPLRLMIGERNFRYCIARVSVAKRWMALAAVIGSSGLKQRSYAIFWQSR